MRVAVLGATGYVGRRLLPLLVEAGHEAVALSRSAARAREALGPRPDVREVDPYDAASLAGALDGCRGIVNLAGENILARRWSSRFKRRLRDSRVETTKAVVAAVESLPEPRRPEVLVNASATGWYGPRDPDEVIDDDTHDADVFVGADFLAEVARQWERAAQDGERVGMRVVRLRIGVVLGKDGGALARMAAPFKAFLGGPIGRGRHAFPWIHREDLCRLVVFALQTPALTGPVNATAPGPVTNKEFCRALGRALGRPCWLPVPPLLLRVALGPVASVLRTGQRVVPSRALDLGFEFRHPSVSDALQAVYGPHRRGEA